MQVLQQKTSTVTRRSGIAGRYSSLYLENVFMCDRRTWSCHRVLISPVSTDKRGSRTPIAITTKSDNLKSSHPHNRR